ncbi:MULTISPECIES: DUF4349 domain-containing protein [Bizionia]|uniref:DUF4349 domain-containing protein n=1 Tax=Bizionia algoritergicola TaxID=291187 RepID=A0A5D0QYP2_9FLAO|nr:MULTISPECIES: DUF4349 domain-containing protein [Bizionia]OBX21210.1 hypothetical protein BAA08_13610 [Bizionia sp. APA-3]TYB73761.1 DUF4349 domain-containing protein [Bizionia algoritergicola]
MKKLIHIIGIILLIAAFGCENNEKRSKSMNLGEMLMEDSQETIVETSHEIQSERKLIKNGDVEFESENLIATRKNIFKTIEKFKGYSTSDNEYKYVYEIRNTLTIRVPSENFDDLLKEITQGVSKFDRKEITITDVTAEFLDIDPRLKTKKELENRYLEILQKANTVTEILEVEKQIGELHADIESIEGRLKFLNNQVSFSTLNVSIYETISKENEFGEKFKSGFKNGWENLIIFFVFLANIWPFILITVGIVILIRAWRIRSVKQK